MCQAHKQGQLDSSAATRLAPKGRSCEGCCRHIEAHPWLLQDQSDDVRAVAAEALLPLTHALAADPPDTLQQILWDILLEVEELSPSTGLCRP